MGRGNSKHQQNNMNEMQDYFIGKKPTIYRKNWEDESKDCNSCLDISYKLYALDRTSRKKFAVDTTLLFSMIPKSKKYEKFANSIRYRASWDSKHVIVYGRKVELVDFGLSCGPIQWPFLVTNTPMPIIGVDFLIAYDLFITTLKKPIMDIHNILTQV